MPSIPDLDFLVKYFGIERMNVIKSQESIDELIELVVNCLLTPGCIDRVKAMRYELVL